MYSSPTVAVKGLLLALLHVDRSLLGLVRFVEGVFQATACLRNLDGVVLSGSPELLEAARFLAAPPVSEDNLDTLVGQRVAGRYAHASVFGPGSGEAAARGSGRATRPPRSRCT